MEVPIAAYILFALQILEAGMFWTGKGNKEWDSLCEAHNALNKIAPPVKYDERIGRELRRHFNFIMTEIKKNNTV